MANEPENTAFADAMKQAEANKDTTPGGATYESEGGELSRRKPGRPPKTTAGVNNTVDTYVPSPERNNRDQALQPTGDGDVAGETATKPFGGKGDHDGDGEPGGTAVSKFFPVTLKRNYRPETDNWRVVNVDGSYGPKPHFDENTTPKVMAGYKIGLPIEEAKKIIAKGIADRADEIK